MERLDIGLKNIKIWIIAIYDCKLNKQPNEIRF
jgi:hypothetical protein